MSARLANFFMTENASGISRRSFGSFVASGLVAACVTKKVVFAGDDMPAPKSAYRGQSIANTPLKWDAFVTPSIHRFCTR